VEITCRVYRPRDPRKTSLFRLFDSLYDLAWGLWEGGFARVRYRRSPEEFLVAFSCRRRGLCPSVGAKRAAELALTAPPSADVGQIRRVYKVDVGPGSDEGADLCRLAAAECAFKVERLL